MKNKHVIFHFLYYVLTIVVYMAFFYASSLMLDLTGKADNLGSVMTVTYGVLFVMTPVLVAILMRLSLFKWYVDPIAAAEIPLFLYVAMLLNQAKRSGNLLSAFRLVNNDLGDDGGTRDYNALTYKIVSWNKIMVELDENGQPVHNTYRKTSVFWYPENQKGIDELWQMEIAKK